MSVVRQIAVGLLVSALAGSAFAQTTTEAPLIQIAPTAPITAPPQPIKTPQANTVPPTPLAAVTSPSIQITPLPVAAPLTTDVPLVTPAVPMAPDQGQATKVDAEKPEPAPPADWRLVLVPAESQVPIDVRIGGSMPTPGHFRLSGEVATADFVLTLPDGIPPPAQLVLSLRSSANVLPDHSKLTVSVNTVETGSIPLDNIGDFADRAVPVIGLVPGANKIRLSVAQLHRIYCGPDASFGVWTEFDLGQSGVSVAPSAVPLTGQGFLAALQAQVASDATIEVLTDPAADESVIRKTASVVAGALGGAQKINLHSFYDLSSGAEAKARVALIAGIEPNASFQRASDGAIVLEVQYAGTTLPDLAGLLPALAVPSDVTALTPGRVTTLSELGSDEIIGNTHYFRQDVNFLLPDDWLLLASQKAEVTLHYGFSADLAEGALLLVKVNGQTIRLLPLDRDGGRVQPPLDMTFRANELNPGLNTLTFEMSVPGDPPDLPCTPRKTDMLVVLGDSTLTVPPSPRMGQADISRSLARLDGTGVVIPAEAAEPAKDEATLIAFGALFRPMVAQGNLVQLHIVNADNSGMVPKGNTDVTRRMLQAAVLPPVAVAAPVAVAKARTTDFKLADANGLLASTSTAPTPVADRAIWTRFLSKDGWLATTASDIRNQTFPGTTSLAEWLKGKSGVALLVQLDPATPDDIWLVAGPEIKMADLARQVDLFRRAGNQDNHGQAALLQRNGTWVSWSESRRPVLLEPLSLSNLRPVLGNYASWSPSIFTLMTIFFALLSVIPALIYVLITRRNGSRI